MKLDNGFTVGARRAHARAPCACAVRQRALAVAAVILSSTSSAATVVSATATGHKPDSAHKRRGTRTLLQFNH